MKISTGIAILLLSVAGHASSGEIDTYYLEKFGEIAPASGRTALKLKHTDVAQKCGMPLRKGLKTDWNKLERSTQKILAKYLVKPALAGEKTYTSSRGHFIIHYASTGVDAPPLTATAPRESPDWVITVADVFEHVFEKEVTTYGYTFPTTAPYPVYLQQLATAHPQVFGYTESDLLTGQSSSSYITIDNDFVEPLYAPYNGLAGLQITAAHEFHHAIQFYYNYYFETWYGEATSSWMEDEVYDSINQLYNYASDYLQNPSISLDLPGDGGYGRWIFNRLLAENHNNEAIRAIWEKLQATQAQHGNDIPMLPVIDSTMKDLRSSLATEFTSFAKRFYEKNWTTHTGELDRLYAVPLTMAATYTSYPVNQENAPSASTTLSHYSLKYFKFIPTPAVTDLAITVNSSDGIQTALFRKTAAGITEIPAVTSSGMNGRVYSVDSFGMLDPDNDEVVLMAANSTNTDNQELRFSSDGSSGQITEPPAPSYQAFTGTGSNSGCFIATAAYGSYLHPKVMLLRRFRDNYLLSNLPGRVVVAAYYKISPPLAAFIRRHEPLRHTTRLLLAPLIFSVEHAWVAPAGIIGCVCTILLMGITRKKRNPTRPEPVADSSGALSD